MALLFPDMLVAQTDQDLRSTHWSVVLLAGASDSPESQAALESLCSDYWTPLYAYARRSGNSEADAKDITQSFFRHFLEKKYIRAADPHRGRFRSFLLTSFRHFQLNDWAKLSAAKRGGRSTKLSWDLLQSESEVVEPAASSPAPDEHYDLQWALTVMQRSLQTLRQEYELSGKHQLFQTLKHFLSSPPETDSYEHAASLLDIRPSNVSLQVFRMRQRYSELVRGEVARTVGRPEELEEELRYLAGLLVR